MWQEVVPRAEQVLGATPELAALVAGTWRGGKALHEEVDDATWQVLLKANLETVYHGLRALLPGMVARGRGSIVVVGSRAAVAPSTSARSAAYAATKAAVVALAQATAAEVMARGVRVNAVLPSTLDTPANRASMPTADASRWVSLSSAAGVIAFLLGDEARDISGAALPVYGRA
jgi:NAD(P)-dependent dehydrogenase (short-subunit alcohol dehydrogenase family)